VQLLLATIVLSVLAGLTSQTIDGRARVAVALIAVAVTATYGLLPRFM
jgi:hypothetical protein